LFVSMVHTDNLNRTVTGQGNTLYPLTYNQYRMLNIFTLKMSTFYTCG